MRKLSLKTLHHKHSDGSKSLNTLLQLKMSECRELKELLTLEDVPLENSMDSISSALLDQIDLIDETVNLIDEVISVYARRTYIAQALVTLDISLD